MWPCTHLCNAVLALADLLAAQLVTLKNLQASGSNLERLLHISKQH